MPVMGYGIFVGNVQIDASWIASYPGRDEATSWILSNPGPCSDFVTCMGERGMPGM